MAENTKPGFDVTGAFANVSLALVDVQRDVSVLKKQVADILNGFVPYLFLCTYINSFWLLDGVIHLIGNHLMRHY